MPTTSRIVTVNASGVVAGSTITCTPGIYTVAPTGTTGLPGNHRPPWIEF